MEHCFAFFCNGDLVEQRLQTIILSFRVDMFWGYRPFLSLHTYKLKHRRTKGEWLRFEDDYDSIVYTTLGIFLGFPRRRCIAPCGFALKRKKERGNLVDRM